MHVAVVDPGVGTARRAIALETGRGLLVGPDNGLLPGAADALGGVVRAVELTNVEWLAEAISATFHGRDVFAPVAARLATGAALTDAGPALDPADLVRLPQPVVRVSAGLVEAEVVMVDRYGNVQLAATGLSPGRVTDRPDGGRHSRHQGVHLRRRRPRVDLVVFVDSAGQVAFAINGGRAAVALSVQPGDLVRMTRSLISHTLIHPVRSRSVPARHHGRMPEGDTVWNTARDAARARWLGRGSSGVATSGYPSSPPSTWPGWRSRSRRAGASTCCCGSSKPGDGQPMTLHSHLRMDGAWRIVLGRTRCGGGRPAHLIRVVLRTADHRGRRVPPARPGPGTDRSGGHPGRAPRTRPARPDGDGGWDRAEAVRRLGDHPERRIAEALLDQRNLAGIGNLYKAEVLFLRGV